MKRIYVRPTVDSTKKTVSKQDLVLVRNDKTMLVSMNWHKTK